MLLRFCPVAALCQAVMISLALLMTGCLVFESVDDLTLPEDSPDANLDGMVEDVVGDAAVDTVADVEPRPDGVNPGDVDGPDQGPPDLADADVVDADMTPDMLFECDEEQPCPDDQACRSGFCEPTCSEALPCEAGQVCENERCIVDPCRDGQQNGSETHVDCGGDLCPACPADAACVKEQDCESGVCREGVCRAPTCQDGVRNGAEYDVDCGEGCGPASCETGDRCAPANVPVPESLFALLDDFCAEGVCDRDTQTCADPRCGDGIVSPPLELCDDGGESSICNDDCTFALCGDGVINMSAGEACEGASSTCNANCTLSRCGDGLVNNAAGELCDDGNDINDDACTNNCVPATCGDGIKGPGEACDSGGTLTAQCDSDCTLPSCGDGFINSVAGEQCDDGNTINNDLCTGTCQTPTCGDGIVRTSGANPEQCDPGPAGITSGCDPDCTLAQCGDGILNPAANEQCDDGNMNDTDSCNNMCRVPDCGDNIVQSGEDCDTGGVSTAACDADCSNVVCGDGFINAAAGEQCDDNNMNNNDACTNTCTTAVCGDGIVRNDPGSNEDCDPGPTMVVSATCNSNCTSAMCGDGIVNAAAGESCDDGGESATCDADCTLAACGDGVINTSAGEQCDDGQESAQCDRDCTVVQCGDGVVNMTAGEMCDDGNRSNFDMCTSMCVAPTCGDGVQNFDEVDTDCGGHCGPGSCAEGQACVANQDCRSELCFGGSCYTAPNCAAIHAFDPTLPSGVYTIDPGAFVPGIPAGPIQVYCDMVTDGGGWTLLFSAGVTFDPTRTGVDHSSGCFAVSASGNDCVSKAYARLPILGDLMIDVSDTPIITTTQMARTLYHGVHPDLVNQTLRTVLTTPNPNGDPDVTFADPGWRVVDPANNLSSIVVDPPCAGGGNNGVWARWSEYELINCDPTYELKLRDDQSNLNACLLLSGFNPQAIPHVLGGRRSNGGWGNCGGWPGNVQVGTSMIGGPRTTRFPEFVRIWTR